MYQPLFVFHIVTRDEFVEIDDDLVEAFVPVTVEGENGQHCQCQWRIISMLFILRSMESDPLNAAAVGRSPG